MLSDFGLSKIVGENARLETACGTPYYVGEFSLKILTRHHAIS
jgi:hypothetical protein